MSEQSGFRNDGTKTARLRKSNDGDDHMKEKDDNIAQAIAEARRARDDGISNRRHHERAEKKREQRPQSEATAP